MIELETAELRPKIDLLSERVPLIELNTFNTPLTDADYQNAEVKIITNNETITAVSKLKIREMGSRYFFILMYCFLEKYFSRGDFKKKW